jgi:hypothetical protein
MANTVADLLWELLQAAGVSRCYGIVGDALNPVIAIAGETPSDQRHGSEARETPSAWPEGRPRTERADSRRGRESRRVPASGARASGSVHAVTCGTSRAERQTSIRGSHLPREALWGRAERF